MNKTRAKELLARYTAGLCTPEEAAQVEAWYQSTARAQEDPRPDINYAERYVQAFERLQQALPQAVVQGKLKQLVRIFSSAAAILLVVSVIAWLFYADRLDEDGPLAPFAEDVAPGGNRATLTLSDGRTINLNEAQSGIVVGAEVTYLDGSAVTENKDGSIPRSPLSISNTVTTPKGGTYQIMLPDGTNVWLNAASALKYPNHFGDEARIVEIVGEAYFSVAHDNRRPFKVISSGQTIEVLGTKFNISAYPDEPETKTTLVEGKIRLSLASRETTELDPGQQATFSDSTSLVVTEVDIFDHTAWREDKILLNDARLPEVMRQIERWYDVTIDLPEFTIKNDRRAYVFINRNENLSNVLKVIEETYQVKLKLAERRVLVIE